MKIPIGIDLGTTNCCLAYIKGGKAEVLEIDGRTTMPSVIAQEPDGSFLIGRRAKECASPLYRYGFVKRHMGRNVEYPFRDGPQTPTQISSRFLGRLKELAVDLLGEVAAVITVPAHFQDTHLKQTRLAATEAGLEVLDIIREPVAAAIAYHREKYLGASGAKTSILVYDLGGGTMDATLCIRAGDHIAVGANGEAYGGDQFLGGLDFDKKLVQLVEPSLRKQGADLCQTDRDDSDRETVPLVFKPYMHELLVQAERVKMKLSETDETQWTQELMVNAAECRINQWIRRADFEHAIEPDLNRTLGFCDEALLKHARGLPGSSERPENEQIAAEAKRLDALILVGGATRMPVIARKLSEHFQRTFGCCPTIKGFREDECVAIGAAYFAAQCLAEQPSSCQHGEFRLDWDITIASQIPAEKATLAGPTGRIEGAILARYSLHLRINDSETSEAIDIDETGRFALPALSLNIGENRFALALLRPDGTESASWTWSIVRGGITASPGGLASAIHVRLRHGKAILLPAGTTPGTAHTQIFYTKDHGPVVRMPLYEGYHAIGTLEFATNARPGTPVDVRATYQPGNIQAVIKVGNGEPQEKSLSMEPQNIQAGRQKLEERFHALDEEISSILENLLVNGEQRAHSLRKQWESLAFDLRSEFEGQMVPDVAKIDDRLQRAEAMLWSLQILKNSVPNLRARCDHLRNLMQELGVGGSWITKQLQDIYARLNGSQNDDHLASIASEIEELRRSIMSRVQLVVTERNVEDKMEEIRSRLTRIRQGSQFDDKNIDRIADMAEQIFGNTQTPTNQRLNRLWELDAQYISERYHLAVVENDRAGLLANTA